MENEIFLTDQDRMQDLLGCEKHLINAYSVFLPETTDCELRRIYTDNMTECAQDQLSVFEAMEKQGWRRSRMRRAMRLPRCAGSSPT